MIIAFITTAVDIIYLGEPITIIAHIYITGPIR
jgi:hypothetical protein